MNSFFSSSSSFSFVVVVKDDDILVVLVLMLFLNTLVVVVVKQSCSFFSCVCLLFRQNCFLSLFEAFLERKFCLLFHFSLFFVLLTRDSHHSFSSLSSFFTKSTSSHVVPLTIKDFVNDDKKRLSSNNQTPPFEDFVNDDFVIL